MCRWQIAAFGIGSEVVRVVMLSKALVVASYQTKLERMAACDDVDLIALVPSSWREGTRRTVLNRSHTKGYEIRVVPLCMNGSFHLHFYPRLCSVLRELDPDLVHVDEEPYNLATYLAVRAAWAVDTPCLFFSWQNLHRRYPWPFTAMEQYVYRHSLGAIAGNRAAAHVLRAKGYAGPVSIIPQFGVDPELFSPPGNRSAEGPMVIGYAGRLVAEKGLWVLLEALEALDAAWELRLVGQGSLEQALRERLRRSGLLERVRFVGQVSSDSMPAQYAQMDVLVLPSLSRPNWTEQFGRVLIEAMACGVTVIGSDSGEIPHVIGRAGVVVPEGDALALRAALDRVLKDAAMRRHLGQQGRSRILEHYSQERIARRTVSFYRELLSSDR